MDTPAVLQFVLYWPYVSLSPYYKGKIIRMKNLDLKSFSQTMLLIRLLFIRVTFSLGRKNDRVFWFVKGFVKMCENNVESFQRGVC